MRTSLKKTNYPLFKPFTDVMGKIPLKIRQFTHYFASINVLEERWCIGMNKKCRPVTREEYEKIISLLRSGFDYHGQKVASKEKIADALVLEANLGIRIEDVLLLKLSDFIKDGSRYRIDIIEKKTGKKREFTVPLEVMSYIQEYSIKWGITKEQKLFSFRERNVQKYLKMVCDLLNLKDVSTHSFRKFYATEIYKNNNFDIRLVQLLLQHSSVLVTQRYIGVDAEKIEKAISGNVNLI